MPSTSLEKQVQLVHLLARRFYQVVPNTLETYCSVTSRISRKVLQGFGVKCDLLPCQLWYAAPNESVVIGFTGEQAPGKWDGHVICASRDWFIDTAVIHLKRQFGIAAPRVASAPRIKVPSQSIGRVDLSPTQRLWWQNPPPGIDPTPIAEPEDIVERHAKALIDDLRIEFEREQAARRSTRGWGGASAAAA